LDKDILSKLEGRIIPAYSWNSSEDFLEKGKGYCILHGNEIVTVAFTAAISDTEVDIGIETKKKYRKQGFGKCVASRMVKDILKMNKTPIWECNTNNLGSKAIAISDKGIVYSPDSTQFISNHAGMTEQEMKIPLIAICKK